jgi:eukaryotic-like serine/threonine-protein kinase
MRSDDFVGDTFAEPSLDGGETLATETRPQARRHAPSLPNLVRGQSIGRYIVVERLGAGAMGVVFAAYDPELGRRVALKLLHDHKQGPIAQARLLREAQALARVAHPRVVTVHDVGVHEGRVFLAMEYVEGQTLRTFMADPARGLDERLAVLIAAGEGLAAAHQAGLVHRDFKPDNVMISATGEVKVMDFGLARTPDGESAASSEFGEGRPPSGPAAQLASSNALTMDGAMLGTPAYMGPELLAGRPADARSDQFAFAVTAYEALFGARPFTGDNLSALALAIADGRIIEPAKHRVPPWLRRVVRRGLADDPEARWPDLESLLAALRDDPLRRRRRRWFTGAALGLSACAGALLTSLLVIHSPELDVCTTLVPELEGRWTAAARERLAVALTRGQTEQTTTSALELLDDYARAWDAASADNCASTHVAQTQSERVHELRASCLRHRRIAFEQLLSSLSEQGAGAAREQALEAAARLPAIATCADVAGLELEPLLPEDPTLREQVEALRDELAAIEPLLEVREIEVAITRARASTQAATQLGHAPLEAEAALVLGRALARSDALEAGVDELRRAYFTAVRSGHAHVQAKAAGELVYVVGYLQQQHAQGAEWAEHGQAIVARVDHGGLIEADMQHALGVLRHASGDKLGSLAAYTRAYELRLAILPDQHPDLARSLFSLGSLHHGLGDLASARDFHERALAMRRSLYGPDHLVPTASLNNLALVLRDQGELEQAKAAFELALAALEQAGGATNDGRARVLTNLADIERRLHALDRARELEERSLALRRASVGDDHPEVADSIVGLARIARDRGELEEAEILARDAVARLERDFARGHPETFAATVVLASVLEARGQLELAAELITAGLSESRREQLDRADLREAEALLERATDGTVQ